MQVFTRFPHAYWGQGAGLRSWGVGRLGPEPKASLPADPALPLPLLVGAPRLLHTDRPPPLILALPGAPAVPMIRASSPLSR